MASVVMKLGKREGSKLVTISCHEGSSIRGEHWTLRPVNALVYGEIGAFINGRHVTIGEPNFNRPRVPR